MARTRQIFKNTIYLYIRQILVLVVALFTTRVVLNVLGVEDFGLYNVIAGVVSMLSVVTASMTSATQRFLAISLGKENKEEFDHIFDVCFTLFLLLSLIVLVLAETLGLWFVNSALKIPSGREAAANWTYHFSVLIFLINLMRVPYNAAIIAHEKMDFYAWVSIFQVSGQLLVAYSLYYIGYDHLITYSFLHVIVTIFTNLVYIFYCHRKLSVRMNHISLEHKYLDHVFSFSFWTFFGSLSTIGTRQGINILINRFFSVRLNAASGISTKVSGSAYDFVANFTTAYRPQILKLFARGENTELYALISQTTRLSCFLFALIMIPLQMNLGAVLSLWLGTVPEYAEIFCNLLMIYLFIDALQSPLIVMVNAIGNIKRFQLTFSALNLLNLPFMWFLLRMGFPPPSIYICFVVFNVITSIYRVFYVKNRSRMSMRNYMKTVIQILATIFIAYCLCYLTESLVPEVDGWLSLVLHSCVLVVLTALTILFVGVKAAERTRLKQLLIRKLSIF